MSRRSRRLQASCLVVILACLVVGGAADATPARAAALQVSAGRGANPAAVAPAVEVAGGASATADATVAVSIAAPDDTSSLVRVSNDGGSTWVERSYATSFTWSLIDPAAGGVDEDGQKTVTVEAGDGVGAWSPLGSDGVLLDRTPPSVTSSLAPVTGWQTSADSWAFDGGSGVLRTEISLDGVRWRSVSPNAYDFWGRDIFDFREGVIGGSWATGERHLFVRAVDRVGNVSPPVDAPTVVEARFVGDDIPGVMFTFPEPAVTGHPYTINPVWDTTYRVPSGFSCRWRLEWESEATYYGAPKDEDYGNVTLTRSPKNGRCEAWTFTLPFTEPLFYHWQLAIVGGADGFESDSLTSAVATTFRAVKDGTSRGIAASNLPLYYILPNRDLVPSGGSVTYRLHAAGTSSIPASGIWACRPARSPEGMYYPPTQRGGTTFTCPIDRPGAWVAEWTYFPSPTRYFRSEYDPVSDTRAPTTSTPAVRVGTTGTPSATYRPVSVSWSGRDSGTGVARYELQRSINGGGWVAVALPSTRAVSVNLGLHVGSTYQFRVRARDRAGNRGSWSYGSAVRAMLYEETSGSIAWSGTWSLEPATGASGVRVRAAEAPGASATFRFSGRAVGWFARKGPGHGFAQVRVDGVLVATVNLEATTLQPSRAVWRTNWASVGSHRVQVRVLGTSGRPRVEVDAFEIVR